MIFHIKWYRLESSFKKQLLSVVAIETFFKEGVVVAVKISVYFLLL